MTKLCLFCGKPMRVVSSGRGFTTYGCPRGDSYYLSEEVPALEAEPQRKEESECVNEEH